MGQKKTQKQLAGLAAARASRHKPSEKENTIAPPQSPPRSTTRSQRHISTLQDRINEQDIHISFLSQSNSELQAENTSLHHQLVHSRSTIASLQEQNAVSAQKLRETTEELKDAYDEISSQAVIIRKKNQRINRLIHDKSVLSAKLACAKQQVLDAVLRAHAAEKLSKSESLRIETLLQTISSLDQKLDTQQQQQKDLYKTLRATNMREKHAKAVLQQVRTQLRAKSKWSGMNRRMFSSQYRSLALAFTRAGCAQARLGPLLIRVGKILGVTIKRSMSRRTVGRVITEAGIKVRLQLGHELARAKSMYLYLLSAEQFVTAHEILQDVCLSSDGTSVRNIQVEARHLTYAAPTYTTDPEAPQTAFRTRVVGVANALDHTAQTQFEGWEEVNRDIFETYMNSPLANRDSLEGYQLEQDDLWRKMVAYNSDHAADVRLTARKCGEKRQAVIETDVGRQELEHMTTEEAEDALWEVVEEICDDPAALNRSSLPEDLRTEALQSLARHVGAHSIDMLPEQQQALLLRIIIAGCCDHKDHNDNATTIALGTEADSDAVERALKASQRGAHKLVSICGNLFRHKDDKRGHQDLHRHFFTKVKFDITGEHSTIKFPDTSNVRYGSHNAGAAELVTYHAAYLEFLSIIRNSKQTPGLNHSEQNAFNGLNDIPTMTECCVMTLYKNAISDPYMAMTRRPGVNHIDLGPLHARILIFYLIPQYPALMSPLMENLSVTNSPSIPYISWPPGSPHLEIILVAFLKATLPAWERFSSEFSDNSIISQLSPAEKLLICIPANNVMNEGLLGGWRVHSRTRSATTISNFSAQTAYHRNDTETFADAVLNTEEDAVYIMRLARVEDVSGVMRKFRDNLLAFKRRVAEESRGKQKAKEDLAAAKTAKLQAIAVITDPQKLGDLNHDELRQQLDIRRKLIKEEIIAKALLKDMKTKPAMLKAILESDERRLAAGTA
ncbi:hypothetical protein MSAN_01120500 [Mycena sanguinolenta]|uniref:Uncharacterized protein n=1 Tax=Mycena sanguinolenta TaxID=230812 RepID=A0A8H6YMF1_9AGAR|nr:hypothetical protein MSAN_01120500 [Mycena sanguinolenta]